ncbi:hypothetical protein S245_034320 [Arachis hypogaea]|nr:uncharacterized protein DS421_10g304880 [Arachis hypogaea]
MFKDLIGKKVLLKVDTKPIGVGKYFGTFQVKRVCGDVVIIAIFELPNYDANDEATPHKEKHVTKCDSIVGKCSIIEGVSSVAVPNDVVIDPESSATKKESPVLINFVGDEESKLLRLDNFKSNTNSIKE